MEKDLEKLIIERLKLEGTTKECFTVAWWALFRKCKIEKLVECLNSGQTWRCAFRTAKRSKKC